MPNPDHLKEQLCEAIGDYGRAIGERDLLKAMDMAKKATEKIETLIELIRKEAMVEMAASLEKQFREGPGLAPDWINEAASAAKHQRENTPYLDDLLKALGWQGGTYHQVVNAVYRLVESEKEREKRHAADHAV